MTNSNEASQNHKIGCESQFIDQLQINSNIEHIMPYAKIREKQSLQILQELDEQTVLV